MTALRESSARAGCELIATHHRSPPDRVRSSESWLPFSLEAPERLVGALPRLHPMLVLHLACSTSADFNTVFRLDCRGTERLIGALDEVAGDRPVGFVFASSIAATDTRCNYGIGKAYVEETLRSRASPRFRPLSVRIPVVEAVQSSGNFDISAERFPAAFFAAIDLAGAIDALLSGRELPYDGGVVPLTAAPVAGVA
jgi:hypothetical protein